MKLNEVKWIYFIFFWGGDRIWGLCIIGAFFVGCVHFANCFQKLLNVALIGAFFAKDLDSYLPAVLLHFDDYKIAAIEYQ